jgi:hypothetical protein
LKINILSTAILASLWALPALARPDPIPPPSGIVVHLFGPGSVTSNILPTGNAPNAQAGSTPNAQGGSTHYVEPSTHDILHQMFVTGDPDQKPGANIPKGRAGFGD